jgi:hypothetical protein
MSGHTLLSLGRASLLPLLAALLVAGSLPARAEGDTIAKRLWVATGAKAVTVDRFREMREDCALAPAPVVTVLQHPAFGKASVKSAKAAGKTDPAGPYAACDGKPFNWTTVTIPAPAKGQGTDKLVLQAQESSGETTTYDVEIVFAKKLPAGKTSGLLEDR